jgi:PII-like signaling protein
MATLQIQPPAKVLMIVFEAHDEWEGIPLHEALAQTLEKRGIAGATALRGVSGYGAHHRLRSKGLLEPSHEPMALLVVDNEAKLREVVPTLRPMVAEGIFVLLDAEVLSVN